MQRASASATEESSARQLVRDCFATKAIARGRPSRTIAKATCDNEVARIE